MMDTVLYRFLTELKTQGEPPYYLYPVHDNANTKLLPLNQLIKLYASHMRE